MTRCVRVGLIAILACAPPAAGQAPQGWLVEQGPVTRFVVGERADPPASAAGPGWSWGAPARGNKDPSWVGYRPITDSANVLSRRFPQVALGPQGEMWLVAGERDENARAWAAFLDAAEAHYRYASNNTNRVKPRGPAVIGRFGECRVMSLPAADSVNVPRVRLSARGGATLDSVRVGRYRRWLVDSTGGCTPSADDRLQLFGFGPPDQLAQPDSAPFLLSISGVETSQTVPVQPGDGWTSFIVDPEKLADPPATLLSIRLPGRATTGDLDLCSIGTIGDACRWERDRRARMYTLNTTAEWPQSGQDSATWQPFERLLSATCRPEPGVDNCPGPWADTVGTHLLTDFAGQLGLGGHVAITSTLEGGFVRWRVDYAWLDSLAQGDSAVSLRLLGGSTISFAVEPEEGGISTGTIIAAVAALLFVVAVVYHFGPWGPLTLPESVRTVLPRLKKRRDDAMDGIARDARQGAPILRSHAQKDLLGVVAFGWALGRRPSTGGAAPRRLLGATIPLRRSGAKDVQPPRPRPNVQQLEKPAGEKGRPMVAAFSDHPRDAGLAVCAGISLARLPQHDALHDLLLAAAPAWLADGRVQRLQGTREEALALFCLGYEVARITPPEDRAPATAWAALLPVATTTGWDSALGRVRNAADPLAWARLGFALASGGGAQERKFEAGIRQVLERASPPQAGREAAAGPEDSGQPTPYDQVLLGARLHRSLADSGRHHDAVLAGQLLRLRGPDDQPGGEAQELVVPIFTHPEVHFWLGHRLAEALETEGAVPIPELLLQPQVEGDLPKTDKDEEEEPPVVPPEEPVGEGTLLALSTGIHQALTDDGQAPPWAVSLVAALRKEIRRTPDAEHPATSRAEAAGKKIEEAARSVVEQLEGFKSKAQSFAEAVDRETKVREQAAKKIGTTAERLDQLVQQVAQLAASVKGMLQQLDKERTAAESNLSGAVATAVKQQTSGAAARWREEAEGIVTPVVKEQMKTQWEPYRLREERLDPYLRNENLIVRLEAFLEALKQDEGFLDRVLALREKVPTETWLVLTDPSSPYLRQAAEQSARSLVEPVYAAVCDQIQRLPDRGGVQQVLEAGSALGYWIDTLWESLQSVDGMNGKPPVRERLRERKNALDEWSASYRAAVEFAAYHANVYRRLLDRVFGGPTRALGEPRFVELSVLEASGLATSGTEFTARLRQYLEPSTRPGCLGEVIRAVQYLLEAFPQEQLHPDERTRFREELRERLASAGLPPDFHELAARVAQGVGLQYQPVRYYQAQIDAPGYEFIGREVTRISLTQRLGFDAQPSSETVVVRLRRPFFFENGTYYAGHAHIARP